MDFSIVYGYRNENDQNTAYAEGNSKVSWPDSMHNKFPSQAVDICPWRNGLQWDDKEAFYLLAGIMLATARSLDIRLRWGGDWDGDFDLHDQVFQDLGHFEIRASCQKTS